MAGAGAGAGTVSGFLVEVGKAGKSASVGTVWGADVLLLFGRRLSARLF